MDETVRKLIEQSLDRSIMKVNQMAADYAQPYLSDFSSALISDLSEQGYEIVHKPKT